MTARSPVSPERAGWKVWVAVAAGGFTGTEARYLLGVLFPEPGGTFPLTTLVINVVGSFLLGWLTVRWTNNPRGLRWLRAGLGPGLLSSFTTFSAVSLAVATEPALLWPYLGGSLALGLAAAVAGMALAGRRAA